MTGTVGRGKGFDVAAGACDHVFEHAAEIGILRIAVGWRSSDEDLVVSFSVLPPWSNWAIMGAHLLGGPAGYEPWVRSS